MPNPQRSTKLFKIGATVLVALLMFYFGFNFLKGINLFNKTSTYYVVFNNAKDLTVSTPIKMDGYKVGLIRDISFDYHNLTGTTVEMALDHELRIPIGSRVAIKGNPLSGAELAIIKTKHTQYYSPGDTVPSVSNADLISQVSDDIIPSMVKMIGKMDTLVMGLDRIVNNQHIFNTFKEIHEASENIRRSTQSMKHIFTNEIPTIVNNVHAASNNINKISTRLEVVDIQRIDSQLNDALQNINKISEKLNSPDNTMGLLLNDSKLYVNLQATAQSADSLLVDIRRNPKRYVTFSLF